MSIQTRLTEVPDGPGAAADRLLARMRTRLAEADLDCRCRTEIESSLGEFADENSAIVFHAALSQARAMREAVLRLLGFLGEIDELDACEGDLSAFAETAGLFDDIRGAAEAGAAAMRRAAAHYPRLARRTRRVAS